MVKSDRKDSFLFILHICRPAQGVAYRSIKSKLLTLKTMRPSRKYLGKKIFNNKMLWFVHVCAYAVNQSVSPSGYRLNCGYLIKSKILNFNGKFSLSSSCALEYGR